MKRKLIAILTMACMICAMSVPVFGAEKTEDESTATSAGTKAEQLKTTTKAYQPCDQTLETDELIESQIHDRGGAILNANHVLWRNKDKTDAKKGGMKYEKKTGIVKAYERIYLDTNGVATFQDQSGKSVTRANVEDIGKYSLLLKDGTLVDRYTNAVIDTQVKTWCEGSLGRDYPRNVLVKKDGSAYVFSSGKVGPKVSNAENIIEAGTGMNLQFLDTKGNLYGCDIEVMFDEATKAWKAVSANAKLITTGVDRLIHSSDARTSVIEAYNVKAGKTYCFDELYFEKEAVDFTNSMSMTSFSTLFVTADKELYEVKWEDDENGNSVRSEKKLANNFKRFTQQGYELEDGTYYDWKGVETDLISETELHDGTYIEETHEPTVIGTLRLKKEGVLYLNDRELLDHVTDYARHPYGSYDAFADQGMPLIITRTDGTVWLYDVAEPKAGSRERIDPPQKLTEAFVESIYGKEEPATKPTEDIKNPSGENNTGKSDQNQNQSTASKDQGSTASTKTKITTKPKKVTLKKATSTKKGTLKLTWKRDTKATGYQAMVAMDKKFKKNKKTATNKKNKTVTKTFTKLKSKKTYYAKVRAYKKIGSKNVYGAYSKVKKAKVK